MNIGRLLRRDRKAAVAIWVAVSAPALLMTTGFGLEMGSWAVAKSQLTVAADAAAAAGALSYAKTANASLAAAEAANVAEVNGIAGVSRRQWTSGNQTMVDGDTTVTVGPGVTDSNRTAVTVTVKRTLPNTFSALISVSGTKTIVATSVAEVYSGTSTGASGACVLALDLGAQNAIKADNMGVITATGCGIHANSNNAQAVYLNSGTIRGDTVSAVGGIKKSNSGSNTFAPWPASAYSSSQANPYASMGNPTLPASYTCHTPPVTSWASSTRQQTPGVYCGNTTFGGNGVADHFAPGVYYILNGNLTFNNATIEPAIGVSFVLLGNNPGYFNYTNYSNTVTQFTAPTSGPTAGLVFWQGCSSTGTAPANVMGGGSTLAITGGFYTPCGALNVANNIRLNAASGATMRVVADTIYAAGSAQINTAAQAVPTAAEVALVR